MMKHNAGILFHRGPMKAGSKNAYDAEGRRKYLTRTEGSAFLDQALQLPKLKALFCLTLYYTGCRISEALALRRQDLDSEIKTVSIRSLKKRNKRDIRRIPVPDFLMDQLLLSTDKAESDWIWRFSRTTGWRIIKTVMKAAQITGIHATAKGLRHGFGVRGAMVRIPTSLIQNWMGHADPSTTAIYLEVRDDEERELIRRTW